MCSAHHDPSESLVPVSDISREKRGPCSATTGSATIPPQHLIPFSSAADRERPPRLSGWERQRFKDLSILQNAALSSLFADFATNCTSQLSTLLGNFVHYWKKLYNTLFCSNKNEPPGNRYLPLGKVRKKTLPLSLAIDEKKTNLEVVFSWTHLPFSFSAWSN